MFTRKGCIRVRLEKGSDAESHIDQALDAALECGTEDFEQELSDQDAVDIEVSLSDVFRFRVENQCENANSLLASQMTCPR